MNTKHYSIGITLGDVTGINCEILYNSLCHIYQGNLYSHITFLLIGNQTRFEYLLNKYYKGFDKRLYTKILESQQFRWVNSDSIELSVSPSWVSDIKLSGEVQYSSLLKSAELLNSGQIQSVVNCPINKHHIHEYLQSPFIGQTEFYCEQSKANNVVMSFMGSKFNVALLTTHLALSEVTHAITYDLILNKIRVIYNHLKNFSGIEKPKLAICGLNPHCSESGLFGDAEEKIIIPALDKLRAEMDIDGPFPADGIFPRLLKNNPYHIIIAHYHDQGTIPFKLMQVDEGVNLTMGLPFIRTSTDHGTAYDIAFKGIAEYNSLLNAIKLACPVN